MTMGKRRRRKDKHKRGPDDFFARGPFAVARYGKVVVMQNRATPKEQAAYLDRLASGFPEAHAEIQSHVQFLIDYLPQFHPLQLLEIAAYALIPHSLGTGSESDMPMEAIYGLKAFEYVQALLVSIDQRNPKERKEVEKADWTEIQSHVTAIYTALLPWYLLHKSVFERHSGKSVSHEMEDFYVMAMLVWCAIRGERYTIHSIPHLRDLLLPHNDVFEEIWGASAESILSGLDHIHFLLIRGVLEPFITMREYHEEFKEWAKKTPAENISPDEMMQKFVDDEIGREEHKRLSDDFQYKISNYGMYEISSSSGIPQKLLHDLSLGPGEAHEFITGEEYPGWPLRELPTWRRPFFRYDNKYYCFNYYVLFDNIYRSLQRLIKEKKPEYKDIWNIRQKDTTESVAIELVESLLPGCEVYRNVFYRWKTGTTKTLNWCELDGLVVFDDHIMIIEVKAGSFTPETPTADLDSWIESIRALAQTPLAQGKRFLDYLESGGSVEVFDEERKSIREISRGDFRIITLVALSLDAFNEWASNIEELEPIGIKVGDNPIWCLSIDDLRVYADIFDNPLIFAHYIEQRHRAFKSKQVSMIDELDHLGAYIIHNNYALFANNLANTGRADGEPAKIGWHGYRKQIDEYFHALIADPDNAIRPKQNLPERIAEILDVMARQAKAGRVEVASYILDMGETGRRGLEEKLSRIIGDLDSVRRPRPISIFGDVRLTAVCWHSQTSKDERYSMRDYAIATALAKSETSRLLMQLTYDEHSGLTDVEFEFVGKADVPFFRREEFASLARKYESSKLRTALEAHQNIGLGRNDSCLCGSGRKIKNCHVELLR